MTRYVKRARAIPLTQAYAAVAARHTAAPKVMWVSAEDYDCMSQSNWYAQKDYRRDAWYVARGVRLDSGKRVIQQAHQFITGYTPMTDHRDGNGLNNRRSNLRPATRAQNGWNRGPRPGSSSKYKGVSWHKQSRRWGVRVRVNGKVVFEREFKDELDAAYAYDDAADEYQGEFAWLNCDRFDEMESWWRWHRV